VAIGAEHVSVERGVDSLVLFASSAATFDVCIGPSRPSLTEQLSFE
jgi:hypothetical protein